VQTILHIHPPPSLASGSRRTFAPCEESNSRMGLISRDRGIEHGVIVVRSPPTMSVQPDIPTSVSVLPPSRDGGLFNSCRGQTSVCSFF
jgi:hypothetical protein